MGLDPSTASSGYCIITDKREIIKYGKITTQKKDFKCEDDRFNHICNILDKLVKDYNVEEVLIENVFIGSRVSGGLSLKKLQGCIARTFKELKVSYITPAAWRKALLNSTKSIKKEDVVEYVKNNVIDIGELKSSTTKKNEDIYESIAIAIAYLNDRENIIKKSQY